MKFLAPQATKFAFRETKPKNQKLFYLLLASKTKSQSETNKFVSLAYLFASSFNWMTQWLVQVAAEMHAHFIIIPRQGFVVT